MTRKRSSSSSLSNFICYCCNVALTKRKVSSLIIGIGIFLCFSTYVIVIISYQKNVISTSGSEQSHYDQAQLYFSEGSENESKAKMEYENYLGQDETESPKPSSLYSLHTSTCKIPEIDPKHSSILKFMEANKTFNLITDCRKRNPAWIYMKERILFINKTEIDLSPFFLNAIHCCYRIIRRVDQPASHSDLNADNQVTLSEKCYPIESGVTKIDTEFIETQCTCDDEPYLANLVYRDYFAVPQSHSDRLVSKKLSEWRRKAKGNVPKQTMTPPNIIIIGIDSVSRLNGRRYLTKTVDLLEKIGAVELKGYTKVADNTYVNMVPIVSGYNAEEIAKICGDPFKYPQDKCPYIYKAFDKAGYVTMLAEDSPALAAFSYLKSGFLRKPTDLYLRPVFLSAISHLAPQPRINWNEPYCLGAYTATEFTFNYILNALKLTSRNSAPLFAHSWVTTLSHETFTTLQYGDEHISNFIQSLISTSSINNNTIFFLMGDHGPRFGDIRSTLHGWYEDRLPLQWVYIPEAIRKEFPEWYDALQTNGGRLTSHYDTYKTLLHILQIFDADKKSNNFYGDTSAISKQKGQSLFKEVSYERTCENAGISRTYCACTMPQTINVSNSKVQIAAKIAVKYLSSLLPLDKCAVPILKEIDKAWYIDNPERPMYVLIIYTDPGSFLFETYVEVENSGKEDEKFVIRTEFFRVNQWSRKPSCVHVPVLQNLCYCK